MERMVSSKRRVKSKPPRHVVPAHGPNESSGHDARADIAGQSLSQSVPMLRAGARFRWTCSLRPTKCRVPLGMLRFDRFHVSGVESARRHRPRGQGKKDGTRMTK